MNKSRRPPSPEAVQMMRRALAVHQQGRLDEAERLYKDVLAAAPNFADAWHFLGVIKSQRNDHAGAVTLIERANTIDPNNAAAHYNLGNAYLKLRRYSDALARFELTLKLKSDHAGALNNRGTVLEQLGRLEEALANYDRALKENPDSAQAWNNRGNVLNGLRRPGEALEACDRALKLEQGRLEALVNRGNALRALNRPVEALEDYDRALRVAPGDAKARNNRGNALVDLGRHDEAFASFDAILTRDPRDENAWCNRASLLLKLRRFEEAVASYDAALALTSPTAEILYGKGYALLELKRNDEAVGVYEALFRAYPDHPYGAGMLLHAKRASCDWENLAAITEAVRNGIRAGKPVTTPYAFVPASESESDNFLCAKILTERKFPPAAKPLWEGGRSAHGRIRLAYLSADFRRHPVATLITGVLEQHDRAKFQRLSALVSVPMTKVPSGSGSRAPSSISMTCRRRPMRKSPLRCTQWRWISSSI